MEIEKILFGIGMKDAEILLKDLILKSNPNYEIIEDVIIHKEREYIIQKIKDNNPSVLILRETLKGTDDILQTIHLIKKHFDIRIIFIAKNRKPGDKLLATLVGYSIFDILMGTQISVEEIAKLVSQKNTIRDVYHLLPTPEDDNYDELLFETEETKSEDQEIEREESIRKRSPFGLIKRDDNKELLDKEEIEEGLDIEGIFSSSKRSKSAQEEGKQVRRLFGQDIDKYKENLLDNQSKGIEQSETPSDIKEADVPQKERVKRKKKKLIPKRVKNNIKKSNNQEVSSTRIEQSEITSKIVKENDAKLNNQLKQLEEELIIEEAKLNKEVEDGNKEKQKPLEDLKKELNSIKRLNKQREKERKKDLKNIEREKKLEEAIKSEKEEEKREEKEFDRTVTQRELDIKEMSAKRLGVVINGSMISTIWNKGKRFFIAISALLVGSLLLNLLVAHFEGKDLYTAFIEYSDFIIKLINVITTYLKKIFIVIGDFVKEFYIKIKTS